MSNDIIANAFKEANIQLRNMESASEGNKFSVGYAKEYSDALAYMVKTSAKMHMKCQEAIVDDAVRTLTQVGYDVVPKSKDPMESATHSLFSAIALLVRNGYKVTDPNGGNC